MIEKLPYMYVLIEEHAMYEKMMSSTVGIDSAPFHFTAFYCDLSTELALLYSILLHKYLRVFVSTIESLFIVEIDFYMYSKNKNNFTCHGRYFLIKQLMRFV